MSTFLYITAALLLASLIIGLVRVWLGPQEADRMLSAQLFGTTGVAILLILAIATGQRALIDIAFVLALLAAVATIAFVRRVGRAKPEVDS
ncbi:monovalent cation/H+ antiporter complex subunit F [Aliidiomarina sanyensis]|uniref:Multiple resistance and pH regulation protein F n=1 Tax=Aliidiomarina sanyensis TaxID=1249555 RepID=A0A432WGF0_9GAMM|nr:monovalent cation/H+ antiporter complex subunit F [Aliidiomarina sanyensis]RUO32854.1 multiple resistance and pH regulation protein F [Aliidiomarina sanyensis]